MKRKRYRGPAYDWRDNEEGWTQPCEVEGCKNRARWSVANWENEDQFGREQWIVRIICCGVHLSRRLDEFDWWMDCMEIYDLARIPERG